MKKGLSLLVVSILTTASLAGCNTDTKAPQSSANSTAPQQKAKFSMSMSDLNIAYTAKSPDINKDKWVLKLEELTNTELNIQIFPAPEFEKKMVQMFAVGDIPDVVQGGGSYSGKEMGGSVQAGIFMPLNDLLSKYGQDLLKKIPKESWERYTYEGKIYAIPDFISNPNKRSTVIRKDLLDKTGLPVPQTVDDYLNVLRAFKKLGVENPYQGRQNLEFADTFFGPYDVFPYLSMFEKQGDQIVPKFFRSADMQKALQVYKTMYDEGLIAKDFVTTTPTTYKNNIIAGKAGMWALEANYVLDQEALIKQNVPTATTVIIPSPIGPDGKSGYALSAPSTRGFFVNAKAKNPENIIKFFNWMVSPEAEKFFTYGIKDDTYQEENGKISFKMDSKMVDETRFRQFWLWFVQDTIYNKGILSLSPEGQNLMKTFDTVMTQGGRDGIDFQPTLSSYSKNPDIAPLGSTAAPMLLPHIMKMITGQEPISNWPQVIEEWKSKGGNDVIKEATERYNKKDGVLMPRR